MLTALAFAHFSSELLLKEQVIIPVKKTLNNAGHIDAKLIDFSEICQKNPAKSAVFYWLFLGEVSPRNFPWNRPIFLRICPWKSFEIWLFSAKIPRNRPIFPRILTFFPRKSREIGRFFREFAPENAAKFCFFFREISEALLIWQTVLLILIFWHVLMLTTSSWPLSPLLFPTKSSCLFFGDVLLLSEAGVTRDFPAESRLVLSGPVASYRKDISLWKNDKTRNTNTLSALSFS